MSLGLLFKIPKFVEAAYWFARAAYEFAAWLRKKKSLDEAKEFAKAGKKQRKANAEDCDDTACAAVKIFGVTGKHVTKVRKESENGSGDSNK